MQDKCERMHLLRKKGSFYRCVSCSVKRSDPSVRQEILGVSSTTPGCHLTLPVILCVNNVNFPVLTLVDSGAEQSLISNNLVEELCISTEKLSQELTMAAITGQDITIISLKVPNLHFVVSGNHPEDGEFFVFHSTKPQVVLGYPWLFKHNPSIDWAGGRVLSWSNFCSKNCLRTAVSPVGSRSITTEEIDLSSVPTCYHDLSPVFSKQSTLSVRRPYDCAINLLPGAPLPACRLYNLSGPERESMQKYIEESLASGIIRPSTSPAGAGFFFVSKKDKTLRPCIDYQGLNRITVKNKYPLPLIDSVYEQLQEATIFTKLNLRNAYHLMTIREGDEWKTAFRTPLGHFEYLVIPFGLTNAPAVFQALVNDVLRDFLNQFVFVYLDDILIYSKNLQQHIQHVRTVLQRLLENKLYVKAEKYDFHAASITFLGLIFERGQVRTDPDKVKAVSDWPTPENRKQLQCFLGFANFYRRFIKDFSRVAAPLTRLTSTLRSFSWDGKAEEAFCKLKNLFSNSPVLIHPDPHKQFMVEVDASDSGVGAVLSQRSQDDQRLHPCAFFSRRLSSAESNYDVGNRELLAIKMALEDWHHWLEGAELPFIIWTDHKNLTYLQQARRLNSRQARWSLFFARFNFSITYRPGSRNIKPDALSQQFSTSDLPKSDETILPSTCTIGSLTWRIENEIREAQQAEPDPGTGPPNRLFVPTSVRSRILEWAHTARFSCHPGINRMLHFTKRYFWLPTLQSDIKEYVLGCPPCAQNKSRHQPPSGLLQPLPTPGRPWSHIALDFVTGLPPSEGNTVILTIIYRFSKMAQFIPLAKLPSALETARLMTQHVFRLHGIPYDIVSDRGPQFTSQVWKAFCQALGVSVSLSSGYHPQSNSQTERCNQELEAAIRCVINNNPASWSQHLPWIEYAHNSHSSSATGISPFEASLGYLPPVFHSQETKLAVPSV